MKDIVISRGREAILSIILLSLMFGGNKAWACVGCGMAESFTPRMLMIGMGFFFLPVLLVGTIIYLIWKDKKIFEMEKNQALNSASGKETK